MRFRYIAILGCLLFSVSSYSQYLGVGSEVIIDTRVKLKSYDTEVINLGRRYFIDRLVIEAKNCSGKSQELLRISSDGVFYQSVLVKESNWRSYLVEFGMYVSTLEITNNNSHCVKIRRFKIPPRRYVGSGPIYDNYSESDTYYLVAELNEIVKVLYNEIPGEYLTKYLVPLSKVIVKTMSVLGTSSELSRDAREAVKNLVRDLKRIEPLVEKLLETPAHQEFARDISSIKRVLENLLGPDAQRQ